MKLRIGIFAALAAFVAGAAIAGAATITNTPIETPICHGRQATIVGTDGDDVIRGTPGRDVIWGGQGDDTIFGSLGNDLICGGPGADVIHGGRGNDEVDGGAGDDDRVFGDLGDDKVIGGAGNDDEVAGDLGIDIVNGGPGNDDLVHGDYGWDRMSGGAGKGDIASFATDVAVGQRRRRLGLAGQAPCRRRRPRQALRLREPRRLGLPRHPDRQRPGQRDRRRPRGRPPDRRRRARHARRRPGQRRLHRGAKGGTISCGKEKAAERLRLRRARRRASGGAGLQIVGGGGRDNFPVAFDEISNTFSVTAAGPLAAGPGCIYPVATRAFAPTQHGSPARSTARACWLMADLGPGNDKLRGRGLAARGRQRPLRRRPRRRRRSTAAPRTT